MAFARTKIQAPRARSDTLIARPALDGRLGEALLTRRLVLVCAAAGFGKTSALARQAALLPAGTAFAWLACDEGDSAMQLLECLVAALEPFDPPWRTAPEALVRAAAQAATPRQRRAIAAEVINALDACEVPHGVIVVDDLHRIDHAPVFEFLDALLERFTPRWTLAIATRAEPRLALARMRVQDEIAEFRSDELRFERDEVHTLAVQAGLGAADAERLLARTQGWPVGLRLALNSQRTAAAASALSIDRHVFDFLACEVIDRLDPALREFLLKTSVLPELTPWRCAAVSGDALSTLRLEQIERDGLFVSVLAGNDLTLRLHDLFRESLEARFERERPAEFAAVLARAAATETDALRRVAWLLRAQSWDEAESLLAASADDLIAGGEATSVRALFERFPPARRSASARLQMLLARTRWDWDAAIGATERAADSFAANHDDAARLDALSYHCVALAGANRHAQARAAAQALLAEPMLTGDALARSLSAAGWVELARGDPQRLAPLWDRLLDTLQGSDSLARWTECAPLAPYIGMPGMRARLTRYVESARRRLPEHPTPLRGMCQVLDGWLTLWAGDVRGAQACADAAVDDSRWLARPANLDAPSRSLQAVLRALHGDRSALALMDTLIADVQASNVALRVEVYLGLYLFLAMRCAAMVDDRVSLHALATRLAGEDHGGRSWLSAPRRAGAAAHLAALAGDADTACARWRAMLDDAHHADLYGQVADTRLRLADALCRRSAPPPEAAAVLSPLFDAIDASGEWGPVLMAGPALLQRLAGVDWHGALTPERVGSLRAWAAQSAALAALANGSNDVERNGHGNSINTNDDAAAHASPLSPREAEVLACIAAGDSNKVIARALDLSPHTVKRHVANILDKLGLASRGQAASWFRAHADRRATSTAA